MAKSEVYSWRLTRDLKVALEEAARRDGVSLSALLERIASEWLAEDGTAIDDATEQERRHKKAAGWIGTVSGGDPTRSIRAQDHVRKRLKKRAR